MAEREQQRDEQPQVGGAHGDRDGGPATRAPNEAQIGGTSPESLGELTRDTDQFTPGTGQSGPGDGEGRGPNSDRASGRES